MKIPYLEVLQIPIFPFQDSPENKDLNLIQIIVSLIKSILSLFKRSWLIMEGKFVFTAENTREKFIADKKRDIEKYQELIGKAEKLISMVQVQD